MVRATDELPSLKTRDINKGFLKPKQKLPCVKNRLYTLVVKKGTIHSFNTPSVRLLPSKVTDPNHSTVQFYVESVKGGSFQMSSSPRGGRSLSGSFF